MEHIENRSLSFTEYAVLLTLTLLADKENGVWHGCAIALSAKFGDGSLSKRAAQDALHSLEAGGYIRRFRSHGQRGNFPILVNRYEITVGGLKGALINADATTDWKNPACSAPTDNETDDRTDEGTDRRTLSRPTRPQDHKTSISQEENKVLHCAPSAEIKKIKQIQKIPTRQHAKVTADQWRGSPPAAGPVMLTFADGGQTVAEWDGQNFTRNGEVLA